MISFPEFLFEKYLQHRLFCFIFSMADIDTPKKVDTADTDSIGATLVNTLFLKKKFDKIVCCLCMHC